MSNALAHDRRGGEDACADALRDRLEEIRHLAEQSRLLALNAALESIGARAGGSAAGEMDILAAQAGGALAETGRVVAAVDTLLEQIRACASYARHCG